MYDENRGAKRNNNKDRRQDKDRKGDKGSDRALKAFKAKRRARPEDNW